MPSGAAPLARGGAAARSLRPAVGASIDAIGMSVPKRTVASAAVAERLGVSEEWILSRTGVRERRIAGEADTVTSLATAARRSSGAGRSPRTSTW